MDDSKNDDATQLRAIVPQQSILLPEYQVAEQIGAGGMARVYRAIHRPLEREVALKILLPEYSEDPSFAERFMREARIAARLVHPHIVQIYDVDQHGEHLYLAMECVKGGDLTEKIEAGLSAKALMKAAEELTEALDFAHSEGYIHRDIKPANILFRRDGSLVLSDFGIARSMRTESELTQVGMIVGTPTYMSPEQALGRELTAASDLYSAGVVLFNLVTGYTPYRSNSAMEILHQHISAPIPDLPKTLPHLQVFFNRALAKDPKDRYSSGAKMLEALRRAFAHFDDMIGIRKQFTAELKKVEHDQVKKPLAAKKPVVAKKSKEQPEPTARPVSSQENKVRIPKEGPRVKAKAANKVAEDVLADNVSTPKKMPSRLMQGLILGAFLAVCAVIYIALPGKPVDTLPDDMLVKNIDADYLRSVSVRAFERYQQASDMQSQLDKQVRRKMALGNTGDADVDQIINARIKSSHAEIEHLIDQVFIDLLEIDRHWLHSPRQVKNIIVKQEKAAANAGELKQRDWLSGLRNVLTKAPTELNTRKQAIKRYIEL
jgi:serine/threonine protein kinase